MGAAADVSANVEAISSYTIGAGGTVSIATFTYFYNTATNQTTRDDPGWSTEELTEAQSLLVCHMIARKLGKTGKTSESLGKGSYSKKLESGLTSWMDEYNAMVARGNASGVISAVDLLGDSGAGYDHLDYVESKKLGLDQEPIKGQVTEDTPDGTTEDYFYGGA